MTSRCKLVDLKNFPACNKQLQFTPLWNDDGIKVIVEIYSVELETMLEYFKARRSWHFKTNFISTFVAKAMHIKSV